MLQVADLHAGEPEEWIEVEAELPDAGTPIWDELLATREGVLPGQVP